MLNTALCKAVMDAEQGLIDADLVGGVIKQRVAYKDTELTEAVNKNTLTEITCNGQTIP